MGELVKGNVLFLETSNGFLKTLSPENFFLQVGLYLAHAVSSFHLQFCISEQCDVILGIASFQILCSLRRAL